MMGIEAVWPALIVLAGVIFFLLLIGNWLTALTFVAGVLCGFMIAVIRQMAKERGK